MIRTTVGPYLILEKLGTGGMGDVFLAEDTRLNRKVALKSITARKLDDPECRRRLLREARAAARLNHPNIAAIYDVVEFHRRSYIVMEYVRGETLAAKLRQGRLSSAEVCAIAVQLAEGLASAHAEGVVHRDLKPANIALTPEGRVKILDFGLAKMPLLADTGGEQSTKSLESAISEHGAVMGTPAYMAPEQLARATADTRSDIYSLGVVLFEMLAGRRPFEAPNTLGIASKILTENAPALGDLEPGLPTTLTAIVDRALARDPDKRYQSASEMQADLVHAAGGGPFPSVDPDAGRGSVPMMSPTPKTVRKGVLIAAGLALLLLVGFFATQRFWRSSAPGERSGAAGRVIAVLPFSNLSGNPANEYLGTGIVDDLIARMGSVSGITVVSRSATLPFQGPEVNLKKVGRELGATFAVQGGVQRSEDRLRVTISLVRTDSTQVTWSAALDGQVSEIFALQRRLAESLIEALQLTIKPTEQRKVAYIATSNVEAFADYAQGRSFLERSDIPGHLDRATQLLQSAVKKDPKFSLPHAALAELYWTRFRNSNDTSWTVQAREEALEALRLDPEQPQVRIALAVVYSGTGRAEEAVEELRRALVIQPNNDDARRQLGEILSSQGKIDEAIAEFHRAIELRPGFSANYRSLGLACYNAGRYREAIAAFQRLTELQPDNARGFQSLGVAYHKIGNTQQALANYEQANRITPVASAYSNIGTIHYDEGRYNKAVQAYQEAIRLTPNNPITHRNLGDALLRLGDLQKARESYLRAVDLTKESLRVNSKDAKNLARLAVLEAKLGLHQDGERHIAEATAISPTDMDVLYRTAVVFALAEKKSEALRAVGDALKNGYSLAEMLKDDDLAFIKQSSEFRSVTEPYSPGNVSK